LTNNLSPQNVLYLEIIIQKGGNSGFDNPKMFNILQANRVNHLVVTGFFLGACVSATSSDAIKHGFAVTLPLHSNCVHNKNPNQISQNALKLHYLRTHNGKEGINIGNF
jgi:nicotinamidase-related amidase